MRIETQNSNVVTEEAEVADTFLSKSLGLMFRRSESVPDGYALVFEFDSEKKVRLHMVFVFFGIDAVFLDSDNRVVKKTRMEAWTGYASHEAKRVIETKAGGLDGVEEGDRLIFRDEDGDRDL